MIDWFKQLTPAAKMLIVGGTAALVLLFALSQLNRGGTIEPSPTVTPPIGGGSDSDNDADAPPTGDGSSEPSGTPSEAPTGSPTDIPTPELPQGTELSVEDQQAATEIGTTGFLEYYDMSADEAPEARQQRLSPYFTEDSPSLSESPLGEMVSADEELKVYSEASLNFSEPIGGDAQAFHILIGATVRGQITPPEDSGEIPYIQKSTMVIFEAALTKQGDSWKITEITEK